MTAASRPRIHHLEQKGDRRARIVARLMRNRERFIGAILLGNNAVNILASALTTSVLISLIGKAGVAYAAIGLTLIILIFAEVLPKTYAIRNAERFSLAVAPPVAAIVWLLSPIVHAVQLVVFGTLRLFGAHGMSDEDVTEEELRGAISLHAMEGSGIKIERDMLHSILDLEQVEVGDVMSHRKSMQMIDASLPPREIIEQVVASPYTRLPVWQGEPENIIGVLHAKDLLRAMHANWTDLDKLDISQVITPPWFVPETATLREQLNAFRERHMHFALVVDEYGSLMGLVTLEDILEEIVGDIADEHDIALRDVVTNADGTLLVPGNVTIRDLNRRFEWDLPDSEAATIAGLVMHQAEKIPEIGQKVTFMGFTIEVRGRQRNQITLLRIEPPAPAEGAQEEEH